MYRVHLTVIFSFQLTVVGLPGPPGPPAVPTVSTTAADSATIQRHRMVDCSVSGWIWILLTVLVACVEVRYWCLINSLRPRQNGRLFADGTFKRIFLNENIRISTKNSLKFVPKGLINNIPALVLIMAWRRPGDKPLSEPMLVRSLTHICVTRPQWVNCNDIALILL